MVRSVAMRRISNHGGKRILRDGRPCGLLRMRAECSGKAIKGY
jgi:hypothetical protein